MYRSIGSTSNTVPDSINPKQVFIIDKRHTILWGVVFPSWVPPHQTVLGDWPGTCPDTAGILIETDCQWKRMRPRALLPLLQLL